MSELATHEVFMPANFAERFMRDGHLTWQSIEPLDADYCNIITEMQDSDALTDALDEAEITWRLI